MKFERHVFVCTNSRESGSTKGSCAEKNSLELMTYLKRMARESGIENIRVNKSGCLGVCERIFREILEFYQVPRGPGAHMGPHMGPIWGPIGAHMGPHMGTIWGPRWAAYGAPRPL